MDRDDYDFEEELEENEIDDSEFEDDENLVKIGDVREDQSEEVYVVTALNEDLSVADDQYFYTVKWSGETSSHTSELFLSECKLLKRFDDWRDAIVSEEFDL